MNPPIDHDKIRHALERTGCSWVLKGSNPEAVLQGIACDIDEFYEEHRKFFGTLPNPDPFSLLDLSPDRAVAFFQTYATARISKEMRIVTWMLLLGARLESLNLKYHMENGLFEMSISTRFYNSSNYYVFNSKNVWDFQVFRHLTVGKSDGKPLVGGYVPLAIVPSETG